MSSRALLAKGYRSSPVGVCRTHRQLPNQLYELVQEVVVSSLPQLRTLTQDPAFQEALALAKRLTPVQRHALAHAGRARWCHLPAPWQPWPGRQEAVAQGLSSAEYQLLEQVPEYLGAYRLTHLGEVVTGLWLVDALTEQQEAIAQWN